MILKIVGRGSDEECCIACMTKFRTEEVHHKLLYFEPFKIMVAYQTIHKFNSQ